VVHFIRSFPGRFPDGLEPDEDGLVALGGVLTPELVIEAYRKGMFPWTGDHPIPWFSPDPRLVLFPRDVHVSRSLRKVIRRGTYEVRFDHAFDQTIRACATTARRGSAGLTWITQNMIVTYGELHRQGVAHSVECYRDGQLCGGLYGLTFGKAFFGESMFARESNASKVALYALCERLRAMDFHFIDCQQVTPHLVSLGGVELSRAEYLRRLDDALGHDSVHRDW
jgi:leucyl/phenylalanyl-tRNA--protein transferase